MEDTFRLDDAFVNEVVDKRYNDMLTTVRWVLERGYSERRTLEAMLQYLADRDLPLVIRDPFERLIMKIETSDLTIEEKEAFYAIIIEGDVKTNDMEKTKEAYLARKQALEQIKEELANDSGRIDRLVERLEKLLKKRTGD